MYLLLIIQGFYFLFTGLWPLIHIKSFFKVTGPKKEVWLVKTFGLMISAMAIAFLTSAYRNEYSFAVISLAILSASTLLVADVHYVKKGAISTVYLLDAAVELIILFCWLAVLI